MDEGGGINHVPVSVQTWGDRWDADGMGGGRNLFQKNIRQQLYRFQLSEDSNLAFQFQLHSFNAIAFYFNWLLKSFDKNVFISNRDFRIITPSQPSITRHSLQMTQLIDFLRIPPSICRLFQNLPRPSIAEMTQWSLSPLSRPLDCVRRRVVASW